MAPNKSNEGEEKEEEEEDYMSMTIEEPPQKETFTQRKRREQREVRSATFRPSFFRIGIIDSDRFFILLPGRSSSQSPFESRTSNPGSCAA